MSEFHEGNGTEITLKRQDYIHAHKTLYKTNYIKIIN